MARTTEDTPTSPYAVLGVSRHATAAQIKHAYRHKAKAAHPDAGGSAGAMQKLNAAYHTLSDSEARRAYDQTQGGQATAQAGPRSAQPSGASPYQGADTEPVVHPRGAQPFSENEAEYIRRQRSAWARNSAWELLRFSLPAAVAAVILARFAPRYIASAADLFLVGALTFLPVYALALSIVFLVDPPLRLVYADIVRGHRTTRGERINAAALVLAYFPLATLWSLIFIYL